MADIAPVMWLMLGFFVPPIAAIIATSFTNSQSYRKFHFGFTILYTVLNLAHLIADLMVQPIIWYQIALMAMLLAIGLLLNWVSFQWLKA
jgi:ABC-type spermidine/putrescine transport system permease subunit II